MIEQMLKNQTKKFGSFFMEIYLNIKNPMLLWHPVDWSGRREDSCGSMVQGRPRRR